ncbi:glycosyltransferase family 39 protein [Pseudarthrobacter enclensis]|uniref:4-amino-4-deoxy-L-arabinose transferase-like glycosyltransferase n=1 Tax=Pseudarthrobacter enclensis TaxID=993070 RepID=A0ABT9RPD7_9MICC|nr:glycosyltransferase family 39 protein [Pseudarthrobacter enclensis]MDP9887101.1 4-amino-4-deoxy-L-arabinose transferase-like glycosyltransferase [Pseudarthrobacter enclensis]
MNSHASQSPGSNLIVKVSKRTFTAGTERTLLGILLSGTALLYAWGLDQNGWANSYYSAAAMSGAEDWTAFLFGSSDPANAISVDKPPAGLWLMALSIRVFGLSPWSILLPQALMGVLSAYLLFRLARTYLGPTPALAASFLLAITPVATVMFRFNNPDALLCLVMIGIAHTTLKSIDRNNSRWLIAAGGLVGFGFLTKQLQIGLIVPAMVVTYLVFAGGKLTIRLLRLGCAGLAAAITGGWWLILVQLTDHASRPFIGGSFTNSAAELTLGYNGLDRLTGQDAASSATKGAWGSVETLDPGLQRFLQPDFSGQFGWFLPLAVAGLVISIVQLHRRQGPRPYRTFLVFNIIWLAVALILIAFMSGIVHPYYGLTAVPPICVLATVALRTFLREGLSGPRRGLAVATLVASALFAYVTAVRSADDFPGLPLVVLLLWAVTIGLYALNVQHASFHRISASLLTFTLLLGPVLWSLNTIFTGHIGAAVSAGPATLGLKADDPSRQRLNPEDPQAVVALMLGDIPAPGILAKLKNDNLATWPAAIVGSESAANYQMETGRPIMALGGFTGSDPFPTMDEFTNLVGDGKIGALVIQNLPPVTAEGRGDAARIVAWVRHHYSAQMIDGAEFYDLAVSR